VHDPERCSNPDFVDQMRTARMPYSSPIPVVAAHLGPDAVNASAGRKCRQPPRGAELALERRLDVFDVLLAIEPALVE
jgi:hypothetical protein